MKDLIQARIREQSNKKREMKVFIDEAESFKENAFYLAQFILLENEIKFLETLLNKTD